MKDKGKVEAEISQAIIRFEKEFLGRGPLEAKTFLIEDMVLVRLKGVLIPAELKLAEAEEKLQVRQLIKQFRYKLLEHGRPLLEVAIRDILGVGVKSLHTDISTKTGERIFVFTLEAEPADMD